MKISKKIFLLPLLIWIMVSSPSSLGGPFYCLNLKSLKTEADLICSGDVVSIENLGKEVLSISSANLKSAPFEADIFRVKFFVRCIFKGNTTNEIIIRCHQNIMAGIPGVSKGSYLIFLKKEGDFFVPVQEFGFVLPLAPEVFQTEMQNMENMLKATIAKGKRDTIRICLDALSQLMPEEDFFSYIKGLAVGKDDFTSGVALLYLLKQGDCDVVPLATAFAEKSYGEKELRNLVAEISYVLNDVKEKERQKEK